MLISMFFVADNIFQGKPNYAKQEYKQSVQLLKILAQLLNLKHCFLGKIHCWIYRVCQFYSY